MLDYVGLIPLFPAIGFAINLFFGRRMSKGAVGFIACAAIGLSFLVSLLVLADLLKLPPASRSVEKVLYAWILSGEFQANVGFSGGPPLPGHDAGGLGCLLRHPHLLRGLHARRSGLPPLLHLPEPFRLLHAHPGRRQQLPAHVRGLGGRGALLLLPDRLLVREEIRLGRGQEGLYRQPDRGLTASSWPSS